jgi:multidrug efflux pump subunit AcrA (membrane-fusion protein)
VITARFAEVGQVVEQARAIFSIAKDGPRDAVFDVYEAIFAQVPDDAQTEITLVSDPKVTAEGTVREIAPAVDTNSGTVQVKIGIPQTPPAMTLGAVVTDSGNLKSSRAVILPWVKSTASPPFGSSIRAVVPSRCGRSWSTPI